DFVATTLEHGDVQRVDVDLHQDLGAFLDRVVNGTEANCRNGVRLADEPLERPVATLLDATGDAGERRQRAERAAATLKLECRHVVLYAFVVANEGRGSEQVDGTIRADEPTAGQDGCRGQEHAGQSG